MLQEQRQLKRERRLAEAKIQKHQMMEKQIIMRTEYSKKLQECQKEIQNNLAQVSKLQEVEQELIVKLQQQTQKLGFGKANIKGLDVKQACDQIMRGEAPLLVKQDSLPKL